jgi:competence protein ComGC
VAARRGAGETVLHEKLNMIRLLQPSLLLLAAAEASWRSFLIDTMPMVIFIVVLLLVMMPTMKKRESKQDAQFDALEKQLKRIADAIEKQNHR